MDDNYMITTFYSTHLALKFEKLLKEHDLKVKIIPVPRKISASCGLAGRFLSKDYDVVINLIKETSFEIEEVYELKNGKYYKNRD